MKKLIMVLILGLLAVPVFGWGQKWIEPYTDKDGTQVEGHWQTPEDVRNDRFSKPGTVNPLTGQFNPYTSDVKKPPIATPPPPSANPLALPDYRPNYKIPGSDVREKK